MQALWGADNELPFSYVRGQNIEMCRADEREEDASLESVLLAGEYIIPKTRMSQQVKGEEGPDSGQQMMNSGEARGNDGLQEQKQFHQPAPSKGFGACRTLIIGGTHEHALTMEELGSPPDMHLASSLLMPKIRDMYPPLTSEGWQPFKCVAGTVAITSTIATAIFNTILIFSFLFFRRC